MARPKSICSIANCGKKHYGHGYCQGHLRRLKEQGDPSAGKRFGEGNVAYYYRTVVLPYEGDECLTWPFTTSSGYGMIRYDGNMRIVSRLLCEEEHGPPPTPKHEAAHSCGKGKQGCVTRRHLSWKTGAENAADKVRHGTIARGAKSGRAKISEEDVIKIRSMRGQIMQADLAKQFGVCEATIRVIQLRQSWTWLD